jgi:hypothetical protein
MEPITVSPSSLRDINLRSEVFTGSNALGQQLLNLPVKQAKVQEKIPLAQPQFLGAEDIRVAPPPDERASPSRAAGANAIRGSLGEGFNLRGKTARWSELNSNCRATSPAVSKSSQNVN